MGSSYLTIVMLNILYFPLLIYVVDASPIDPKIVNGVDTTTKVSYMCSIQFNNKHICGGSIITSQTVLTAAHCVIDNTTSKFSIGYNSLNIDQFDKLDVISIIKQPNFNKTTFDYDCALFITSISFPSCILPIPICYPPKINEPATIYGYGLQSEGGTPSNTLKQATLMVLDNCGYINSTRITPRMLCASNPGTDSCQGDSGGPIVQKNDGKQTLIGCVSWGYGCARPNYPGVYTNTFAILKWIHDESVGQTAEYCFY